MSGIVQNCNLVGSQRSRLAMTRCERKEGTDAGSRHEATVKTCSAIIQSSDSIGVGLTRGLAVVSLSTASSRTRRKRSRRTRG